LKIIIEGWEYIMKKGATRSGILIRTFALSELFHLEHVPLILKHQMEILLYIEIRGTTLIEF